MSDLTVVRLIVDKIQKYSGNKDAQEALKELLDELKRYYDGEPNKNVEKSGLNESKI